MIVRKITRITTTIQKIKRLPYAAGEAVVKKDLPGHPAAIDLTMITPWIPFSFSMVESST
jgi:hypothetical protein